VRFVRLVATLAGLLLVGSTFWGWGIGDNARSPASPPPTTTTTTTTAPVADPWAVSPTQAEYQPTPVRLQEPEPTRIDIAAIGVTSDLVRLGLRTDGTMEVPRDFARAGWFTNGPRPGENGPAVIAGHVDSMTGPAAFYRLKDVQPGTDIAVTRADGTNITFRVARVETYEKQAFPTTAVFGPTPDAELRLVTCGGDFDWSKRSYKANIVVYATRVAA
jgi:hypothetical protein